MPRILSLKQFTREPSHCKNYGSPSRFLIESFRFHNLWRCKPVCLPVHRHRQNISQWQRVVYIPKMSYAHEEIWLNFCSCTAEKHAYGLPHLEVGDGWCRRPRASIRNQWEIPAQILGYLDFPFVFQLEFN